MASSHEFELKVPEAGESVQQAMIESWLVDDGAFVELDEPVVELETDKASMEIVAETAGVIHILAEVSSMVQVGQVIATITTDQKKPSQRPKQKNKPEQATQKSDSVTESSTPSPQSNLITTSSSHGPAAQLAAHKAGVDLNTLSQRSGPGGRVTKKDIQTLNTSPSQNTELNQVLEQPSISSDKKISSDTKRTIEKKPLSLMRKRIAQRLLSATQTTAMLTTFNEVDMGEIMAIRSRYKETFYSNHNIKLGFMGFFIQASAQALQEFPQMNAYLEDDHMVFHHYADIGVAVSTEKGLVVPVIKNAQSMNLASIEQRLVELATKARQKSLKIEDMQGGTFTITNGGVFGSLLSTPIINPPQSAILGMHKIEKRPQVTEDGSIVARPMMYLALSYDHRSVDGKDAVSFLVRIKQLLEDPIRLWLKV